FSAPPDLSSLSLHVALPLPRRPIDLYFAESGITPYVAVEANSITALLQFVRRGSTATVLPDAITRERPDLQPIALSPPLPTRTRSEEHTSELQSRENPVCRL